MTLYDMLLNKYGYSNPFSFEEIRKSTNFSIVELKKIFLSSILTAIIKF